MRTKIREEDVVTVKVMKVVTLEMTDVEFNKLFEAMGGSKLQSDEGEHYKTLWEFYKTLEEINETIKS